MGLIIALDDKNEASGELFWDDGDSRGTFLLSQRALWNEWITCARAHARHTKVKPN